MVQECVGLSEELFLMNEYTCLTHSFPIHLSPAPGNIKKPYGFPMFSGGIERAHWERMG